MSSASSLGEVPDLPLVLQPYVIDIVVIAAVLIVSYLIYRFVLSKAIDELARKAGMSKLMATFWKIAVFLIVLAIALSSALAFLGIEMGAAFTAIGIIAGVIVVIVLVGLRDVIANALAGYSILMYKPFKRGDIISVNGITGVVREIASLYTEVVSENGVHYIPNSLFLKSATSIKRPEDLTRINLVVKVRSTSNLELAERLIVSTASSCKDLAIPPSPSVYIKEVTGEYVSLELVAYVINPNKAEFVSSELLKNIKRAFDRAGIKLF